MNVLMAIQMNRCITAEPAEAFDLSIHFQTELGFDPAAGWMSAWEERQQEPLTEGSLQVTVAIHKIWHQGRVGA